MDIYEITGDVTGVSQAGVNFLQPADAFQEVRNGFVYRQVLQSRKGVGYFAPRLADESRVLGIFEYILPNASKVLLAIDRNFLYKYNTISGVFDQVPFGGTLVGYPGFGILGNDYYVSGTAFPQDSSAPDPVVVNGPRFIFTVRGSNVTPNGSFIFFYTGTDIALGEVKNFTDVVDNPPFTNPPQGQLTNARYVLWFGERLNFTIPTIAGTDYNQGILYSGIRNAAGNGDKFNVAGSGLLQADTYENITGQTILGQVIALNFTRSNWTVEKTKDAFNPYFIRKVPSVLGTNAEFSAVSWSDQTHSVGKTGVIVTDGRQSLREDNKIPRFTADKIDAVNFNLTYGGFDRLNNQFLWSFKSQGTDETDLTQDQILVYNYEEESWSTFDQRFSVFGQTDVGLDLTWNDIDDVISGNPSWSQWDTTQEIWDNIGLGASVQKTLAGDDLGFIYELNQDYYDYFEPISNITQAVNAVVTVQPSAFKVGDKVIIHDVQGMTEINSSASFDDVTNVNIWEVVSATDTLLTLNVNSIDFTAYVPNTGVISKVIEFSAQTIPFNPYRSQGKRCYIGMIEFLIDTNGGNLLVDLYSDEEETPYKANTLLLPNNESTKAREWLTLVADHEANFHTIVMKQENSSEQIRLVSMRIHCKMGGSTSD